MELLLTSTDFVIKQGDYSLWCDRNSGNGNLFPKTNAFNLGFEDPIVCIGFIYGFIGRVRFFPDGVWYIIVITEHSRMSNFSDFSIYRIDKVALLPLIQNVQVESFDFDLPPTIRRTDFQNVLKEFMHSKTPSLTPNRLTTLPSCPFPDQDKSKQKEHTRREKLEGKFCETFVRMFNDSNFYYSLDCDLTNSLQRKFSHNNGPFSWKNWDDRFFWNKSMLKELFLYDENLSNPWILPVIQGFYDTTSCFLNFNSIPSLLTKQFYSSPKDDFSVYHTGVDKLFSDFEEISIGQVQSNSQCKQSENSKIFHLSLISRRSRYRAGTRYKRRGIDSRGFVANYVETELVIMVGSQWFSYVQVRGSIPIFWSQSGPKYKPLPQLTNDFRSTQNAFNLHISSQILAYKHISIINLVDEIGKEGIVKNEFESHFKALKSPYLNYYFFDFHKQCKGFQFSKLQNIFRQISEQFENYNFFWISKTNDQKIDMLCEQRGVFRVNCMDCLDRTNVIQAIIAREMLDRVLMKLGLLMPDQSLPFSCLQSYRKLWADNGDAISRQYAGTAAMKGDLTRTGHRNLKGTVRDGLSSANRYYINHFKDTLRQRVIDSMQDDFDNDLDLSENSILNQEDIFENEINDYCSLIHAVREYLDLGESIRGWALKELDSFRCISSESSDQLCVLFLLPNDILVLLYEVSTDQILSYELLEYKSLERVQFGTFNKYKLLDRKHAIQIHYTREGSSGYHYAFSSLQSKSDDIKLELSIVFNEIKLTTTRLNYFPIYLTIKLSNQVSKPHKIFKIHNVESNLQELNELRRLIKIESYHNPSANQLKSIDNDMKDMKGKCVSSSTENLIIHDGETSELYYIPNSLEKIHNFNPIVDHTLKHYGFPIRKSLSDYSIYSHSSISSNTSLNSLNQDVFLFPRTKTEIMSVNSIPHIKSTQENMSVST